MRCSTVTHLIPSVLGLGALLTLASCAGVSSPVRPVAGPSGFGPGADAAIGSLTGGGSGASGAVVIQPNQTPRQNSTY